MSLNSALVNSGRSLEVFSAGISVAGQNLANATTPGYIREELRLESGTTFRQGNNLLGTGVDSGGVRQKLDLFLESRLHAAAAERAGAAAHRDALLALESTLGELTDADLSTALSDFSAAVQDVVTDPHSEPLRGQLIRQGESLARDLNALRGRVAGLADDTAARADGLVSEANTLIDEIASLGPEIGRLEAGGLLKSDAGSLRSRRYAAVQRLAEIVPVRYEARPDGGVDLFSGDNALILGTHVQHLGSVAPAGREDARLTVRLTGTDAEIPLAGGELRGLLTAGEAGGGKFLDDLDSLAAALIETVNRVHAGGEGLRGFPSVTAAAEVRDPAASLAELNTLDGVAFAPDHGGFTLKVVNTGTGAAERTRIAVDLDGLGADTSLADLRAVLDAVPDISATIDALGRLTLNAADGYELRFADDTSGVLAALGVNTFFAGTDAATIAVDARLRDDPGLLAVGRGGGPGDNTNAVALANALAGPIAGPPDSLGGSVADRYAAMVADVAGRAASESAFADGADAHLESLRSQREQFSGVNLDEEAIRVMELQRSYQASARIISAVDELFGVLLSI